MQTPSSKEGCFLHMPDKYYIGSSGVAGYREEKPVSVKKIGEKAYIVGDLVTDAACAGGLTAAVIGGSRVSGCVGAGRIANRGRGVVAGAAAASQQCCQQQADQYEG